MTNPLQGFGGVSVEWKNAGVGAGMGGGVSGAKENGGGGPFLENLKSAMDEIASMQSEADGKVAQLLSGNGQDVHSAMIAVEKANLSFQMMVQVRNKIVQAYQQISAMPF